MCKTEVRCFVLEVIVEVGIGTEGPKESGRGRGVGFPDEEKSPVDLLIRGFSRAVFNTGDADLSC